MIDSKNDGSNDESLLVPVPVITSTSDMSKIEKKLTKLFKCCFYQEKCFFTTDDPVGFIQHANFKHKDAKSFCIYCYHLSGEKEEFNQPNDLVDHIIYQHGLRLYQCNLCFYRGSRISHILLHQANVHGNKYQATLNGDQSPGMCKVLTCQQIIQGPKPSDIVYWSNCRVEQVLNEPTPTRPDATPRYQCLYCDFVSLVSHVVFFHVCKAHPDHNLCLYDKYHEPTPEFNETEEIFEEDSDSDKELDTIVADLHAFGTNDDNIDHDMTPFEDALPENISDDDTPQQTSNQASTSQLSARERLFALKGVRIARKKAEEDKNGAKAKKSTAKQAAKLSDNDNKTESEDEIEEPLSRRLPKGFRPENEAQLFEPIALNANKPNATASSRNKFKCLICRDEKPIGKTAIDNHLQHVHKTLSSFKCFECDFVGARFEIIAHFASQHKSSSSTVKVVKFIVAFDDQTQTIMQNIVPFSKPFVGPKSKQKAAIEKSKVKNLSNTIKNATHMGAKNWNEKAPRPSPGPSKDDKEPAKNDSESEKSEAEVEQDIESNRKKRKTRGKKRRLNVADEEPEVKKKKDQNEKLVSIKSSRARETDYCFCLFCTDYSTTNFEEALSHMKLHLDVGIISCPYCIYKCDSTKILTEHCLTEHRDNVASFNDLGKANNLHVNYIIEFLNEQFNVRRKGDQMSADQAARYSYVTCPFCERANKLTGDSDYHFTKWKSFKIHFWRHVNASFLECKRCDAYVPRTRKRTHLEDIHFDDFENVDIYEIKDLTDHYTEPLLPRVIASLKSLKRKCKARFMERIKFEFNIKDCCVKLTRTDLLGDFPVEVKEEPIDEYSIN